MAKFDVTKHELVPKHSKLSDKETKELFAKYAIELPNLPRIFKDDPAIENLDVKEGDIVKIVRKSHTAGETVFYRRVVA
ncbi:DNA-directed RNA polymerase subunit H [Candidatus Woesearchaeota archaeon]|nr:DNA-directed RNA polymerase subunit H [Candidatus Woesearchaeota archaeon]